MHLRSACNISLADKTNRIFYIVVIKSLDVTKESSIVSNKDCCFDLSHYYKGIS